MKLSKALKRIRKAAKKAAKPQPLPGTPFRPPRPTPAGKPPRPTPLPGHRPGQLPGQATKAAAAAHQRQLATLKSLEARVAKERATWVEWCNKAGDPSISPEERRVARKEADGYSKVLDASLIALASYRAMLRS